MTPSFIMIDNRSVDLHVVSACSLGKGRMRTANGSWRTTSPVFLFRGLGDIINHTVGSFDYTRGPTVLAIGGWFNGDEHHYQARLFLPLSSKKCRYSTASPIFEWVGTDRRIRGLAHLLEFLTLNLEHLPMYYRTTGGLGNLAGALWLQEKHSEAGFCVRKHCLLVSRY